MKGFEKAAEWFENRAKATPMIGERWMCELAAEALREKANCVMVQKWISVEERLPIHMGTVLVHDCLKSKTTFAAYHRDSWDIGFDFTVTHWMPMPEEPNETKHKHATQKASEEA